MLFEEGSAKRKEVSDLALTSIIVEAEQALTVMADEEAISHNNDWIVDNGCSNHTTGDKQKLISRMEYTEAMETL